jgi:hypothetical protein
MFPFWNKKNAHADISTIKLIMLLPGNTLVKFGWLELQEA